MGPHFQHLLHLLVILSLASCAIPQGDQASPEGVHFQALQARLSGDLETQWALVHPEVKAQLQRLHAAESEASRLVTERYPEGQRGATLALLASGGTSTLSDPKAVFGHLARLEPPESLSLPQRLGARVEGVEQQEGVATVTSRAGQKTTTKQHSDALWYLTLSEEEMTALSRAVAQAETNLAKVQANVAKLGTASSK